ncbi:armadillo-type protein [Boletus edulis BED1]|uniref:Armadillo-type protein n=1 Tax=Boletus edulis BED1 TaxID=1328754 RepID=A0AAD4BZF5_BOLED|nr:armadillo-type protein [Boletus edulis BED1]
MPVVQRSAKKRPAPSQGGPKAKKAHISKQATSRHGNESVKKRRQPVTHPVDELKEQDSDEESEDADESADERSAKDEMDVDNGLSKDPNAAKESHKAQRVLQDQRKAARPHSQLIANAKRVWSLARQKNISSTERRKHVQDLLDIVTGKVKDIVLKHDASRIIQTIVKYGGQKERDQVAGELKGHYRELAQSKYSKFLVTKLIRFCPAHRASILLEFQSASSVLADAFELYANAYERSILLTDFYGREAILFSTNRGTPQDIESAKKGFRGLLDGAEGDRRKRLLAALKENLTTIFNNPDKGTITHAIVHRALWELLSAVDSIEEESDKDKLRREIFESCQDVLAEMMHTKDGSRAVREFIAYGTAKDRKHIIKVIKPHVERMCVDDEAQLVLFTALDVIEYVFSTPNSPRKTLVSDIISHASSLATSPQGRRSLLHLIVPRSRRHFTPAQIVMIAETDRIRAKTSKKDSVARETEIRKAASEGLLQFVVENGAETARDTGGSLLVQEIMLYAEGDKSPAMKALTGALASPYPSEDPARPHPIDLPHTSRMYKTLLQGGHFSHSERSVARSSAFSPSEFASVFLSIVGGGTTIAIAQGDGAFVVAEFLERIRQEGNDAQKTQVRGWFDDSFVARMKDSEGKGKNVLVEKIRALL